MNRRTALKNTSLLIGSTLGSASLIGLLQSCQEQERISWQPLFFTQQQAAIVSEICETILPRTNTPGAKDLKVDIFVDLMCKKSLSPEDQKHILKGLKEFTEYCQNSFNNDFVDLSERERKEALLKLEKDSNKFNPKVWGSTIGKQDPIDFYRRIKQFTLLGYFTSKDLNDVT